MKISYNEYPTLLFTSFRQDDAPEGLPLKVVTPQVLSFLKGCVGFNEMFALIAIKNTECKGNSNIHYCLGDKLYHKVDSDDSFRNQYFGNVFKEYIKPKHGVILLPYGGQYVYMFLEEKETQIVKNHRGRYIAVAFFIQDTFAGFEEGYITEEGIRVLNTGHYEGGMNQGGYISFVLITLAYAGDKAYPLAETNVSENIYQLT